MFYFLISLGSWHDGNYDRAPDCSGRDQYVMASSPGVISGRILLKANLLCWCLPKRKSRWLFFWQKKCSSKNSSPSDRLFPPHQPVQNPGWNWSFPPGVRSNLVACRNRPSRTSWAAVVAPWRNQCPWRHQCPAEVFFFGMGNFLGNEKVVI